MASPIVLDDALSDRIEHLAQQRRIPASSLVSEALSQYIAREDARLSFVAEAEASWSQFRLTGRHLTGEEVADWLGTWGSPDEKPAPACHE